MNNVLNNSLVLISAINYVRDLCKDGIGNDISKMKALNFLVELNLDRCNNGLDFVEDIFTAAYINSSDKKEYYRIIQVRLW